MGLGVFFLDFVDWCDDLVVVQCFYCQVEVYLVVVYVGVVVCDCFGIQFFGVCDCCVDDQVVVGYQQWVLILIVFVGLYEWFDEVVLDCWVVVYGDVVCYVEFFCVCFDVGVFFGIYVVGVGEYGVYGLVVFDQVWDVEVGVEVVGEGEDDVFVYGLYILERKGLDRRSDDDVWFVVYWKIYGVGDEVGVVGCFVCGFGFGWVVGSGDDNNGMQYYFGEVVVVVFGDYCVFGVVVVVGDDYVGYGCYVQVGQYVVGGQCGYQYVFWVVLGGVVVEGGVG